MRPSQCGQHHAGVQKSTACLDNLMFLFVAFNPERTVDMPYVGNLSGTASLMIIIDALAPPHTTCRACAAATTQQCRVIQPSPNTNSWRAAYNSQNAVFTNIDIKLRMYGALTLLRS